MSFLDLYSAVFYEPIYNLLVLLYDLIPGHDIGVAIIFLTVIVKAILWPLSARALKSQKALQDIQPKMEALKKEYADKKEELGKKMMELYSREKVNPASSCLPTLIQLPFFIAIYQAMGRGLSSDGFEKLYSWVPNPGTIDPLAFGGLLDLSHPIVVLAVLAAVAQFFQAKMMITRPQPAVKGAEDEAVASIVNKQMVYMMPVLTVIIGIKLPGGLMIYWLTMTVLTIVQQRMFFGGRGKAGGQGPAATAVS
ncbi:YidC/Oxa1 family membrane protein insertase [Candidatus Uhrbacteria bacterium]|nr:YidC/Oxa1 family membrane protein insertase [Candidatus Uhrbacteria bacterium]